MKPAWDELAEDFADSHSVLIADVDCTSNEAKSLCEENDIKGFPTIKYFTPDTGKAGSDYNGGRSHGELKKFVDDYLHVECSVTNPGDACSDQERSYIEKQKEKGTASWEAEVKRLEGLTNKAASMKPDKHKWLLQRIDILNQFLGRKTAKSRKWYAKYGWRSVMVVVSTLVVLLVSTLVWRSSRDQSVAKPAEPKEEPKEEPNDEPKDESKDESKEPSAEKSD